MNTVDFPILSMLIVVPAVGAVLVLLLSKRRPEYMRLVAAIAAVVSAALSVWLTYDFVRHDDGFQYVSQHPWLEEWGIVWHLGIDGISLFLLLLTVLLFPLSTLGIDPLND